jgi:hypothetical protein
MTEPTPAPEAVEPETPAAETAPDAPEAPAEETPAVEETNDVAALRREAAGHRVKAREAVEQRDALAARVETYLRREVERLAAEHLAQGEDVFLSVELADLLDEDGEVDAAKVDAAAAKIVSTRPGLAAERSSFDGGVRRIQAAPGPSFADSFRKAARR